MTPLALLEDHRRGALLAAFVAGLVYLNAIPLGFAWDDVEIIKGNEALHSWAGIVGGLGAPYWPGHYGAAVGAWRPVVSTWWGLQWLAWATPPRSSTWSACCCTRPPPASSCSCSAG